MYKNTLITDIKQIFCCHFVRKMIIFIYLLCIYEFLFTVLPSLCDETSTTLPRFARIRPLRNIQWIPQVNFKFVVIGSKFSKY